MVFFSSRISPRASTVIFFDRSPLATAVVTSAMLRTWPVRLLAIALTLSVRSFQVPATPRTSAWPPSLPSVPTSLRDARDFRGERPELVDHLVDDVLDLQDLAADFDGDLLRQVAVGDGRRHARHVAQLHGEVAGQLVDVVGQVLPGAGHALHFRLAAELAFGADLARHARDFRGEGVELIDHDVDGVLQLEDLAADVDGDLLGEVAVGDRGGDVGDVPDLRGQVAGHEVDRVGQVLPGARDPRHVRLAAELPFRCRPRARRA